MVEFPEWLKKDLSSILKMTIIEIELSQMYFNRYVYRYILEENSRMFLSEDILKGSYEKLVKIAQRRMLLSPIVDNYKMLNQ